MGAKKKLLDYLLNHVGETISLDVLRSVAGNIHECQRVLRTLRQEGWQLETLRSKKSYILHSRVKLAGNIRKSVDDKTRYLVFEKFKFTCQSCGKTSKDGIVLEIDHILPVNWLGSSEFSNLQPLCKQCNQGKKDFVGSLNPKIMIELMAVSSGYEKIKKLFQLSPNVPIPVWELECISGIRDWTRTIRLIRDKENMKIKPMPKGKPEYYIYLAN